jgi:hypothetical protein
MGAQFALTRRAHEDGSVGRELDLIHALKGALFDLLQRLVRTGDEPPEGVTATFLTHIELAAR